MLYYYKLGSFPRIEARFILPIVPFFLIASGCFWHQLRSNKVIVALLVLLIISYNSVCSTLVGTRFLNNPRIQAKEWAEQYISKNSSVEVDVYSTLTDQQNLKLKEISSPNVSGRNRIFDQIFKGAPFIVGYKEDQRREDEMVNWYSLFELSKRQPDFISVNSLFYNRFMEPGLKRDLYPSMYQYFRELIHEQYFYQIVFAQESKQSPAWIYLQDIDFLHNRAIIFARKTIKR